MINVNRVSTKIFKVLKGHGFQVTLFSKDGQNVLDPDQARRMFVDEPNLLIFVDEEAEEVQFNKNSNTPLQVYDSLISQIKKIALSYALKFKLKEFGKKIKPKHFSYQTKKSKNVQESIMGSNTTIKLNKYTVTGIFRVNKRDLHNTLTSISASTPTEAINIAKAYFRRYEPSLPAPKKCVVKQEADLSTADDEMVPESLSNVREDNKETDSNSLSESFSKMFGTKKTSKQFLENVKIIVKHKTPVDEEVRGARTRNIHSIFLETDAGRVKFPHNSLVGARAMARHMMSGGIMEDKVGEYILESTKNLSELKGFMHYVVTNNLINESNTDVVNTAKENVGVLKTELKRLSGAKTYEAIAARINEQTEELVEDDTDKYKEMFTVKSFDAKYESILPVLGKMVKVNENKLKRIQESSMGTIYLAPKKPKRVSAILAFESKRKEFGYKVTELAESIDNNSELSSYVANIGKKIMQESELSEFEVSVLENVLRNSAPKKLTESKGTDAFTLFEQRMEILATPVFEAKATPVKDANGTVSYYIGKGGTRKLHNDEGPARVWADGTEEYFLNGKRKDKVQWEQETRAKTNYKQDRFNQRPDSMSVIEPNSAGPADGYTWDDLEQNVMVRATK